MAVGLDHETLEFTLESIDEFARRELPDSLVLERDEFPEALVRRMCGEELGSSSCSCPSDMGGNALTAYEQARDSPHEQAPIFDVCTRARPSDLLDVLPALAEQLRKVSA